jgi:hypothetical protein
MQHPRKSSLCAIRIGLAVLLVVLAGSVVPHPGQAAGIDKFVAIGTGSVSGVFYPVGKGMCKFVNDGRLQHGVRCLAYETGGSVYNIEAVRSRELDIGITLSDLAALSYQGKGHSGSDLGPATELRALANLYAMPVGIVVKKDLNIKTLDDFAGKRFNFGNRGSGNRAMAEMLFEYKKWTPKDFTKLTELSTKEMGEAFCDNQIDILLEILGHPAEFYEDMIKKCNGAIFNFPPEDVAGLIKILPFSAPQKIPGKMYTDTPDDIRTFGYQAIMFSTSKVHPTTIFNVMNATFGNMEKFREVHPALKATNLKKMTDGLTVPLHDGAKQFYTQHGIMPK